MPRGMEMQEIDSGAEGPLPDGVTEMASDTPGLWLGGIVDPLPAIDLEMLGVLIKAARIRARMKTPETLAVRMAELGYKATARAIYGWEAGVAAPSLEAFLVLVAALDPPKGVTWFEDAFRPDLWDLLCTRGKNQ